MRMRSGRAGVAMRATYLARVLPVLSTALLLLGLVALPAGADSATGSMSGRVYGPTDPQAGAHPPLAGVVVTVVRANDENAPPVATATSGAIGEYTVDGLPPGTYKVHFAGDPELYQPDWYSGATSFATATPVTIFAGLRRDGVS